MTDPERPRHIEVGDDGQPAAAAEVTTSAGADGTVRASLHAPAGHITPGSRASLVDAVMDLPEVQASARIEAAIPLGDGESLERLRERTEDAVTRPAGSTTLLDADIPSGSQPGPGQDPDGGTNPATVTARGQGRRRGGRQGRSPVNAAVVAAFAGRPADGQLDALWTGPGRHGCPARPCVTGSARRCVPALSCIPVLAGAARRGAGYLAIRKARDEDGSFSSGGPVPRGWVLPV
jgi:hypothetical protein